MLFDRWQHCRQMGNTARNIFNLSSITDTNNDTFIYDIHTLISNTAYLTSIIEQNNTMMVKRILIEYRFKKIFVFILVNKFFTY